MALLPKSLLRVIESFERLPGVGPKTAVRLAFYLLHVPQSDLELFAQSLKDLKSHTVLCSICKNVTESDPCVVCSQSSRDTHLICVVEQPTDVLSIEKTGKFRGVYHVLHGSIDPLNNIGPDEIYLADLIRRLEKLDDEDIEVILATNPNMEGEATSMYIMRQINQHMGNREKKVKVTRLAHGLPVGADIEYADEVTLSRALEGRTTY
jgi:recombination protein RecR